MENFGFVCLILCVWIGLVLAMTQISCLTRNALHLAADALYDLGTGLEVLSPLCPQLFLEMAGLGNFAKVHSLTSLFWFSLNLHLFFFTPKVLILCRLIFVFSTIRIKMRWEATRKLVFILLLLCSFSSP